MITAKYFSVSETLSPVHAGLNGGVIKHTDKKPVKLGMCGNIMAAVRKEGVIVKRCVGGEPC